jgi:hypothetical protein
MRLTSSAWPFSIEPTQLPKNVRDFPILAANEDSGSSSRDAIKFAGDDEAFQRGLQRYEMNIWNTQTERELFPGLIRLEHDVLKTSPLRLFLYAITLRATTDKEENNIRSTFQLLRGVENRIKLVCSSHVPRIPHDTYLEYATPDGDRSSLYRQAVSHSHRPIMDDLYSPGLIPLLQASSPFLRQWRLL